MGKANRVRASEQYYLKAREVVPWGANTGAKCPHFYQAYAGSVPLYFQRGKGSHLWDIDGNEYVDYRAALGPIILGYAYEPVDKAAKAAIDNGFLFSMSSAVEYELADRIRGLVPSAEMVRFLKTGGDACSACVRVARAYTGRDLVLSQGYHGWHDTFLVKDANDGRGIPEGLGRYVCEFPYDDADALERLLRDHGTEAACIILTPYDGAEPPKNLPRIRALATKYGVVLIYDEVKTGFRLAAGSAGAMLGAEPDMIAFSKAMANGYPISAFTGRREIMKLMDYSGKPSYVMITTTFAGDGLAIAASLATIAELEKPETFRKIYRLGDALMSGLKAVFDQAGLPSKVCGFAPWFSALPVQPPGAGARNLPVQFLKGMLDRGIFTLGDWHLTYSHSDADIAMTLEAARSTVKSL